MSLKSRAQQLKADIPALFLALNSPDTPVLARILAALTVAYALSPIDLIPDFLPVLGYLDDVLLLPAMAAFTIRLIPRPVMDACRRQAADLWQNVKPKRWYYALPSVVIWVLIAWVILKQCFKKKTGENGLILSRLCFMEDSSHTPGQYRNRRT